MAQSALGLAYRVTSRVACAVQEQLEISQQYGLGVGEGGAREEPNPPKGRGSRVTLPDDFLRPPG